MEENKLPLVSYFVIAYKEEKYIREAVQSAFDQDYPNLEIILSDDNSPDNTFNIMKEMASNYRGPHKIILNQNIPNLGPRDHYCKILYELAHGDIIIFADGDDISAKNRTRVTVDYMLMHPDVISLSFESQHINEEGQIINNAYSLGLSKGESSIYTLDDFVKFDLYNLSDDSRAIRRKLINSFPPLKYSISEDIFLFYRSMLIGRYAYLRMPLVSYRQRSSSIMGTSRRKKIATRAEIKKFEETSKKQIIEDFEYAVKQGIINPEHIDLINEKTYKLIKWLSPTRKKISNRIVRYIIKFLNKHFDI